MHIRLSLETAVMTLFVGCGPVNTPGHASSRQASLDASSSEQAQEGGANTSSGSAGQVDEQAPAEENKSLIENKPDISVTTPPTGTEAESDPSAEGGQKSVACPVEASTLKQPSYIIAESGVASEGKNPVAVFPVALTSPAVQTVCVSYKTRDGSATAPLRYRTTSGVLVFAPGDLKKTVSVPIVDDDQEELTQEFHLDLSNPVNGTILEATGVMSILDNDYPGPSTLTITDASAKRGLVGTRTLSFMLTLDKPIDHDISIQYAMQDFTAKSGVDYAAASGTVVFKAHELAKQIDVTIYSTEELVPDRIFYLNLTPNAEISMPKLIAAGIVKYGN